MTFDNRPVRRSDNDDRTRTAKSATVTKAANTRKPASGTARTTSARTASGTVRTAGARSGSAGRTNVTRSNSVPGRMTGTRTNAAGRPAGTRPASGTNRSSSAAKRPASRPTAKGGSPAWLKKRVGGFDLETILAVALIVVVLTVVGIVTASIIKGFSDRNTEYKDRTDLANISKAEDIAANSNTGSQNGSGQQNASDHGSSTGTGANPNGSENTAGTESTGNNGNTGTVGGAYSFNTGSNTGSGTGSNGTVDIPSVGTKTNGLRSCRIRTVGDFVISSDMISAAKAYAKANGSSLSHDFSGMLAIIGDYMADADFTVANVDGSMGGKYKYGYTGYPQINTPESLIINLKNVGVDMLTLANNHMLDGWYDGLLAEIDNVDAAGLYRVGAYKTQEERNKPVVIEINGIKVGFMNYTVSLNNFENYGVDKKALEFGAGWTKNSNCAEDAKRLREAGAEVIVCYMHWGEEYKTTSNKSQRDMAETLMKAGVDVIVGGHPHVVQKAEWLNGTNQFGGQQQTFCIYSLGNYLTDHTEKNTDGGIIFDFTIQEKGDGTFAIEAPSYITTYVWKTGKDDPYSRGYVVVPCRRYMDAKTKPQGMSDAEYNSMVASHKAQLAILEEGVGTQKVK